jgi:hypothetical protein
LLAKANDAGSGLARRERRGDHRAHRRRGGGVNQVTHTNLLKPANAPMTNDMPAFGVSLELDQLTRSGGLFIKGGRGGNLGLAKYHPRCSDFEICPAGWNKRRGHLAWFGFNGRKTL